MPTHKQPRNDPDSPKDAERREPEAAPQTAAELRRLHETMPDAFAAIDLAGRITDCNRAFEELLGYSARELRNLSWEDLTPEEHRTEDLKRLELIREGGDITVAYEKAYRHKNGSLVPVELRSFALHDDQGRLSGYAAVIRDITDRKMYQSHLEQTNAALQRELAEKAGQLEETRQSFRRLSEAAYEGIVVSHDGVILDCNDQFASMVGRSAGDLIGSPGLEVVDPSCQEHVINRVTTGDEKTYQTRLKRPDGSVFPVEIRARMLRARDRLIRVSAIRDLSEIKRMEDEIEERQHGNEEFRQRAATLTPREREVVKLVAQGLLNKEIADRLGLALITVKVHRGRAMRKLGAGNAAELGQFAMLAGIVQPE